MLAPKPSPAVPSTRNTDEAPFAARLFAAAQKRSASDSSPVRSDEGRNPGVDVQVSKATTGNEARTTPAEFTGLEAGERDFAAEDQHFAESLQAETISYLTVFPFRLVNNDNQSVTGNGQAPGAETGISRLLDGVPQGTASPGPAIQVIGPSAQPAAQSTPPGTEKTSSSSPLQAASTANSGNATGVQTAPPAFTVASAGAATGFAFSLSTVNPQQPIPKNGPTEEQSETSPLTAAFAKTTTSPETQAAAAPLVQQGLSKIVNTDYGQIITFQKSSEAEEMAVTMAPSEPRTIISGTAGQRQDANSAYIHSHLPSESPKVLTDSGSPLQQENPSNQPQGQDQQIGPEQALAAKVQATAGQDGSPLLFSHQMAANQPGASTTAGDTSSLMRLSSGLSVPDGTVMDQVITHFSVDRKLDTSAINLKLYPQELGELRMEIKVEQDNIKAHIIVQTPQAQEMLDRHMPRLREALAHQGLQLQQIEVTVTSDYNTDSHRFQEGSGQQMNRPAYARAPREAFHLDQREEQEEVTSPPRNLSVLI